LPAGKTKGAGNPKKKGFQKTLKPSVKILRNKKKSRRRKNHLTHHGGLEKKRRRPLKGKNSKNTRKKVSKVAPRGEHHESSVNLDKKKN